MLLCLIYDISFKSSTHNHPPATLWSLFSCSPVSVMKIFCPLFYWNTSVTFLLLICYCSVVFHHQSCSIVCCSYQTFLNQSFHSTRILWGWDMRYSTSCSGVWDKVPLVLGHEIQYLWSWDMRYSASCSGTWDTVPLLVQLLLPNNLYYVVS